MQLSTHFCDPALWAQTHFGGVSLGDKRRTVRVQTLVAGWARQPGASSPRLSAGRAYASKAAYRLLGLGQATPDALQASHRQLVRQQLHEASTYLLLEDTTQLSWPEAAERRAGLGPVGTGKATSQGVLLYSLVAARWLDLAPELAAKRPALPLLGLLDQQFHVRQPAPAAEKAALHGGSRPRQQRLRESALWTQSLRQLGSPPPVARWVVVADRGAESTSTWFSAGLRTWALWCALPRTEPWWSRPPARRPGSCLPWRAPSPAPATSHWYCAGDLASRHAMSHCR